MTNKKIGKSENGPTSGKCGNCSNGEAVDVCGPAISCKEGRGYNSLKNHPCPEYVPKPTAPADLWGELEIRIKQYNGTWIADTSGDIACRFILEQMKYLSQFKPTKPEAKQDDTAGLGCNICGSRKVYIRGRYPKEPDRLICPCCLVEELEDIVSDFNNAAGQENK